MSDIWTIPRNDLAAALAYYRRAKYDGRLVDSEVRVLARLQDDPTEFFSEIAKLNQ